MNDVRTQRLDNQLRTVGILGLLVATLGGVGWLLGGLPGALVALVFAGALAFLAPRPSAQRLLRSRGSRALHPAEVPGLHHAVEALSRRAGLERAPQLHLLAAHGPQALSTEGPDGAIVGVTPELLRVLGPRQTLAVVAHEIAHLKNGDLTLLRIAETVFALTRSAAQLSIYMLLFGVPFFWLTGAPVPWLTLGLLLAAPWAVRLLVAALSRAREHDADATAAELSGDPLALASALERIERFSAAPWWAWWIRLDAPSSLRTHPPTADRVERLLTLGWRARA